MIKTTQTVSVTVSVPYMRGGEVYKEIIAFDICIDGNSFMAKTETCKEQCRRLGIEEAVAFDFVDNTIVIGKKTSEESFEVIKDIVQELMILDIIN